MMDLVLSGFHFIFVYFEDIILASKSREQHRRDVEKVFRRLW
jgi:hypothetical protein